MTLGDFQVRSASPRSALSALSAVRSSAYVGVPPAPCLPKRGSSLLSVSPTHSALFFSSGARATIGLWGHIFSRHRCLVLVAALRLLLRAWQQPFQLRCRLALQFQFAISALSWPWPCGWRSKIRPEFIRRAHCGGVCPSLLALCLFFYAGRMPCGLPGVYPTSAGSGLPSWCSVLCKNFQDWDAIPWIRWQSVSDQPLPATYALVGVHCAKATILSRAQSA